MGIHILCNIGAARGTMGIHLSRQIRAVQRIFQRVRVNARCKMGTHIHFHTKKFTNICLKGKKSCAAREPDLYFRRTNISVTASLNLNTLSECTDISGVNAFISPTIIIDRGHV